MLLNKSLYSMFSDPFLPRVAVTVGKGSGYARLALERMARTGISICGCGELFPVIC